MEVTTVGLDLAKHVFSGSRDRRGGRGGRAQSVTSVATAAISSPSSHRASLAWKQCGTSHHWARELTRLGHQVRLMPPAYVKPYVKRGKDRCRRRGSDLRGGDPADDAVRSNEVVRPASHLVDASYPRSVSQAADAVGEHDTWPFGRFGIDIPQGLERALIMARQVIDGESPDVPAAAVKVVHMLSQQALDTHAQLREIDRALVTLQRNRRCGTAPCHNPGHRPGQRNGAGGIGFPTPGQFPFGSTVRGLARLDAAAELQRWQATPGPHYEDGRPLPAQAPGDRLQRRSFGVPARASNSVSQRLADLLTRKPVRLATVAMANKLARIVWAVLVRGEVFQKSHVPIMGRVGKFVRSQLRDQLKEVAGREAQ